MECIENLGVVGWSIYRGPIDLMYHSSNMQIVFLLVSKRSQQKVDLRSYISLDGRFENNSCN